MASLRTIIAQGRKRIGLLVGAGAGAGTAKDDGTYPLIPAVEGLTTQVLGALEPQYGAQIAALKAELDKHDIETILSRIRSLSKVIGKSKIHGLNGDGFKTFGEEICTEIGKIVNVRLPKKGCAYNDIVNWITGIARDHPIEVFTTNYDLLFEEAFEAVQGTILRWIYWWARAVLRSGIGRQQRPAAALDKTVEAARIARLEGERQG